MGYIFTATSRQDIYIYIYIYIYIDPAPLLKTLQQSLNTNMKHHKNVMNLIILAGAFLTRNYIYIYGFSF